MLKRLYLDSWITMDCCTTLCQLFVCLPPCFIKTLKADTQIGAIKRLLKWSKIMIKFSVINLDTSTAVTCRKRQAASGCHAWLDCKLRTPIPISLLLVQPSLGYILCEPSCQLLCSEYPETMLHSLYGGTFHHSTGTIGSDHTSISVSRPYEGRECKLWISWISQVLHGEDGFCWLN